MRSHGRALAVIGGITALTGLLAAIGVTAGLAPGQRTFTAVSAPVQLLISVGVPFLGVVMTYDHHRQKPPLDVLWTLLRAVGLAVVFAIFGSAVTAGSITLLPSSMEPGRWSNATPVALGSVLVQVVAMLTGTGLGLLLRRPALACLATILLPLGLWLALGVLAPQARVWLTPFESANTLLAGTMTTASWMPFAVMVSLWNVALNLAGYGRLLRSDDGDEPAASSLPLVGT